jgi:tetratricopeptide (TPR) repeat protein
MINVGGPIVSGHFATGRGRFQTLAVALATIMGLAAAAAWMLARSDWWTTPIRQAERALDAGDLTRARMLLTRVIRDEPRQAHARLLYARLLRLSGRLKDADVALGQAMDMGVPQASLWREYGLLIAASDFRKAEPILLRASKAHPGDVEVLRALADGLSSQGRWPDAADFYSQWLRVEPNRTEALLGRSRALVQAGQARDAVSELRAILARQPDNYEARLLLANCFLSNAEMDQAAPELERCCRLRPDRPEPLAGLASCAVEVHNLDRARELLNRAVALDPSHIAALTSRANLALKLRQYDLALADYERVVTLDPTNKQGHMHLAQLFDRRGDRKRAGEHEQAFRSLQSEQENRFRTIRGMH